MSGRLLLRSAAATELAEAVAWYDQQRAGLGQALTDDVHRTIADVISRPQSFPAAYRSLRRALVDRFPYAIYFVAESGQIIVFAILHTSRNRGKILRDRL